MTADEIRKELFSKQDLKYRDMQVKIIPTVEPSSIIGVRTPELKAMAKEILKSGDYKDFLADLPHKYFEENQLHAFILSGMKDADECFEELEKFLPYVDTVYVTRIDRTYDADSYFPNLDEDENWEIASESEEQTCFDLTYRYVTYQRKKS